MAPRDTTNLVHVAESDVSESKSKSLLWAYLLWLPPFGILGFHRFYLGHWFMGILYLFTLGYAGIGWLVDGVLMSQIVSDRNHAWEEYAANPKQLTGQDRCQYGLRDRNLRDAYILTLNPLGIMGFQHVYQGQHWYRLAYTLSGGLFLIGWITDIYRMPSLVKKTNEKLANLRNGMTRHELTHSTLSDCTTVQAYLFAIPGFFGFQHFYLGRCKIGFVYVFTAGLFGIGWLVDLIRMPTLVKRSNQERKENTQNTKHVDDAYLLGFALGIFGAHHFYLNRPCMGILYIFTLGLFGIGWLVDLIRMPSLVKEANLRNKQSVTIIPATAQHSGYIIPPSNTNTYVFTQSRHYSHPSNVSNLPPQNNQPPMAMPPPLYQTGYQTGYHPPPMAMPPPQYQTGYQYQPHQQQQQLKQYPPS